MRESSACSGALPREHLLTLPDPHSTLCMVCVTVGCPSVRPSVPSTSAVLLQHGRGQQISIDSCGRRVRLGYQSTAAGARAAAAGSVMLGADGGGSTQNYFVGLEFLSVQRDATL